MKVIFRCPPELEGLLPPPIPAKRGLPDWLRRMPTTTPAPNFGVELETVKQCPPFVDAMTAGFLMPLVCDVEVEKGRFTWHWEPPPRRFGNYTRAPLSFHPNDQVVETPFFDPERQPIKFTNFWQIETPPGVAMLVTHTANRADLPFRSLTGLIDASSWKSLVHFPALWLDDDFCGTLKKGTPVVQCYPVVQDTIEFDMRVFDEEDAAALAATEQSQKEVTGTYRKIARDGRDRG